MYKRKERNSIKDLMECGVGKWTQEQLLVIKCKANVCAERSSEHEKLIYRNKADAQLDKKVNKKLPDIFKLRVNCLAMYVYLTKLKSN